VPQCHTQGQEPVGQAQGQGFILKAKDLTISDQDQGQGLKICPRGHLNAKGQGQQHWRTLPPGFCPAASVLTTSTCTHT